MVWCFKESVVVKLIMMFEILPLDGRVWKENVGNILNIRLEARSSTYILEARSSTLNDVQNITMCGRRI